MPTSIGIRVAIVAGVAAVVAGTSLAAYGYAFGFDDPGATAGPTTGTPATVASTSTTTTQAPTTTAAPRTTTTRPVQPEPPVVQMPAGTFRIGSSGPAVLTYEQRLAALHFDPGAVDGNYDQATAYAVQAVQKLVGLPRDGSIGEATRFAISVFKYPAPLAPAATAEPNRVEIDLDRQVLILYQNYQVRLITTTSTGSGKRFCGGDQGCQYAVTPPGKFAFTWHHDGWRTSKLGHLWNPYYFNGGIAVHGYTSVPAYPASHGCARIPMHIANYFPTLVTKGEPVYVIGQEAPKTGGPLPPPTSATTAPPATTPPSTSAPTPTTAAHPPTTVKSSGSTTPTTKPKTATT